MKAIAYTKYGPPQVLHIQEAEKPTPNDDQVLVRVHAVSLNPAEAHMMSGNPVARLLGRNGLFKPMNRILGADFSGRVEGVGRSTTLFHPGDDVFGRKAMGGFAEYVCVSENPIAPKPANITFEQTAAVPVAGVTALQSLRDAGQIRPGQKVLINGASGGVGTFSVQIAKTFGAYVIGVCSTRNSELVRSLGADRVIDYTRDDFMRTGRRYDLIIDNVGNLPAADCVRALNSKGIYVGVGYTSVLLLFQHFVMGQVLSRAGDKKMGTMLARITQKDLLVLKEMMETGQVVPVVDRVYRITDVPEAYRYLKTRHAPGKIVVTFE